jgi:subtilisin family serine protease
MHVRSVAASILVAAVALIAAGNAHPHRALDRYVVAVDPAVPLTRVAGDLSARGYDVRASLDDLHAVEVAVPTGGDAPALASMPAVRYAEPVTAVAVADNPSDPLFSRQNGYLYPVNAPAAWDITKGDPGIVVAVVDTGVDVRHPDLQANIWTNPNEIPNNGADDDGNGCVDDVNGCSFVSDSSPGCHNVTNGFVNDDIGHGTFVSGVIAAAGNGAGIVGVARNVRIMPVKVLDCYGAGDSVATARGMLYAVRNGARVINMSLGGIQDAQVIRDAVGQATAAGVLVVAATGNDGAPSVAFPARIPDVLAVGALAPSADRRASFSNYGPEVDAVAVGEDVVGTLPQRLCFVFLPCIGADPYATGSGTSFSTPQVSGLAALMLSLRPSLSPAQITNMIKSTATPMPDGNTPGWAGAGRINMLKALQAVQSDHPAGDPCVIASVEDGDSFTCQGGLRVRMLQIDAPDLGQCGGDWAKAALQYIFLTPGRIVYLQYDATRTDAQARTLAVPMWRGADGADYNLSIVMVYVGLAHAADVGAGNVAFHDWALASQTWASAAQWNMWAPGKTFNGGC